jgi:hypothetical protein
VHDVISAEKERRKERGEHISHLHVVNLSDTCADCLDMIVRHVTSFHAIQVSFPLHFAVQAFCRLLFERRNQMRY